MKKRRFAVGLLIVLAVIFAVFMFWPAGMNSTGSMIETDPAGEPGAGQDR